MNPLARNRWRAASTFLWSCVCNPSTFRIFSRKPSTRRRAWLLTAAQVSLLLCLGLASGAQSSKVQKVPDEEQNFGNTTAHAVMPGAGPGAPTAEESTKNAVDPNAYSIGEQDSLAVTVWKEKEISGNVVVRPDGKITVPLVGEVQVVGMTPVQLESLLAEKLKPYVTVPQVSVAVTEIRSRKVYLIGHAGREGTFMINSSTKVLQIIAQAGGLKDFAKRKKIYVLRQRGSEQLRFPFNFDDVIRGKHTEQNILLEPGDTIVVP